MEKRTLKIIVIVIAVLITVFAIFSLVFGIYNYAFFESQVNEKIESFGLIGLFLLSFFVDLVPQYISPHIGILSAALLGFDPMLVVLVVIAGSMAGSVIGYELGRIYGCDFVRGMIGQRRINKVERFFNEKGKWAVALAAVSPVPYIPLALGAFKMVRKNFVIFGLIPRVLGIVVSALIYLVL